MRIHAVGRNRPVAGVGHINVVGIGAGSRSEGLDADDRARPRSGRERAVQSRREGSGVDVGYVYGDRIARRVRLEIVVVVGGIVAAIEEQPRRRTELCGKGDAGDVGERVAGVAGREGGDRARAATCRIGHIHPGAGDRIVAGNGGGRAQPRCERTAGQWGEAAGVGIDAIA